MILIYQIIPILMFFYPSQNPIDLLGKNIAVIPDYKLFDISDKKEEENNELAFYTYESNSKLTFLGEDIKRFYFKTNDKDTIVEIYFSLYNIIKKGNYIELFVEEYGEPTQSFCIDQVINISNTTTNEGSTTGMVLKKRECDYREESPISSIWKVRNNCFFELTYPFKFDTSQELDIHFTINAQ